MFNKLLAETMIDVSNDLVPSNLQEPVRSCCENQSLQYTGLDLKEFLYPDIKYWN